MHLVNGTGNSPSPGRPTSGVVKQDKSSGGSVDTTKTRSGPQRVIMSSGERPIGAAKGKQTNSMAPCHPPPPQPSVDHCPLTQRWLTAMPCSLALRVGDPPQPSVCPGGGRGWTPKPNLPRHAAPSTNGVFPVAKQVHRDFPSRQVPRELRTMPFDSIGQYLPVAHAHPHLVVPKACASRALC